MVFEPISPDECQATSGIKEIWLLVNHDGDGHLVPPLDGPDFVEAGLAYFSQTDAFAARDYQNQSYGLECVAVRVFPRGQQSPTAQV
jgi:hypothetical protein